MKSFTFIVFIVIAVAANLSWIWPLVEFILYLVKDDPFNWISVWTCIGLYVSLIITFIKLKM